MTYSPTRCNANKNLIICCQSAVNGTTSSGDESKKRSKEKKRRVRDSVEKPLWDCLPDVLLEYIFSYLSISERYAASQVCPNWYRVFSSPEVWRTFVFTDRMLTRRKFNYYLGYQHILDHQRTQICLHKFGHNIRRLVLNSTSNFFNLYEFISIVSHYCEFFEENPMKYLRSLNFSFACDSASSSSEEVLFGTGGRILQALKRMMKNLTGLRYLSLEDLLLDTNEAMYLLDDVAQNCGETLTTLRIINCAKIPYGFLHIGVFLRLRTLIISPQHLSDDIVALIGHTSLVDLYILQTKHTGVATPVSRQTWRECRKVSPKLCVHLMIDGKVKTDILWQEDAPVKSIIYKSSYHRVTTESALTAATLYGKDLEVYAFLGLPRFYAPKSFQERADSSLVLLCRSCPNLHTLVVRERVSTSTVLLIAHNRPSLKRFIVRRNAIIKRSDWPKNPEWTDEFYYWMRRTSHCYDMTAQEVSHILGTTWRPVLDKEFKLCNV